tara:strand:+ start:38183 stop:38482 length:300 start_codon:yes stop_codon:yes gene_type:complete
MIKNDYNSKEGTIITPISGGREHFTHRFPTRATKTYKYETVQGDTCYSLAAIIFGTDENHWVLQDMNEPHLGIGYKVGEVLNLPEGVVKPMNGSTKIFL